MPGGNGPIAPLDLVAQRQRLAGRVEQAIARVIGHGQFIMGPEVTELEDQLAGYCGARAAVTCASGTDALVLVLMAWGVGPGDAVLVPSFTFAATAEAVALVGATPVFVDIDSADFNVDVASVEGAVRAVETDTDLRPAAVIAVDLFGQPADYAALEKVATGHGLRLLADAAQSFGGRLGDRQVGTFGDATATSFFPTKPLACYGDGGAIFTDDEDLADTLRLLRVHGQDRHRRCVHVGINGRLDTIQAAVLLEKLAIFDEELSARARVAEAYSAALDDVVEVPRRRVDATSAWAQYTVQVDDRDGLVAALASAGISAAVYYRHPLHDHPAYRAFPVAPGGLPVSERAAGRVISLPLHPYLQEEDQTRVIATVRRAVGGG